MQVTLNVPGIFGIGDRKVAMLVADGFMAQSVSVALGNRKLPPGFDGTLELRRAAFEILPGLAPSSHPSLSAVTLSPSHPHSPPPSLRAASTADPPVPETGPRLLVPPPPPPPPLTVTHP